MIVMTGTPIRYMIVQNDLRAVCVINFSHFIVASTVTLRPLVICFEKGYLQ